jgi:hypothetical protein
MAGIWDTLKQGASDVWQGTPERFEQLPNLNPAQQGMQGNILQSAGQMLQQPQFDFSPIAAQQMANYKQNIIPEIANQFGQGGGLHSSGFRNALASSGSTLAQNLAAMQAHIGMQQQNMNNDRLKILLGTGMNPSQDTVQYAGQPGMKQYLAQAAGQLPQLFGGGNAFGGGNQQGGTQQGAGNSGWMAKLLSALSRGATGASMGSGFGPVGAGIGGGIGVLSSLFV